MRFAVVVHKDPDSSYGVAAPDLPGYISAGDTLDEAFENVVEAILGHVEVLLMDGVPYPGAGRLRNIRRTRITKAGCAGDTWMLTLPRHGFRRSVSTYRSPPTCLRLRTRPRKLRALLGRISWRRRWRRSPSNGRRCHSGHEKRRVWRLPVACQSSGLSELIFQLANPLFGLDTSSFGMKTGGAFAFEGWHVFSRRRIVPTQLTLLPAQVQVQ